MDITRRRGLELLAALPVAAAVAPGAASAPWRGRRLGVQLWSVKDELQRDFDGTMRRLSAIGYGRCEAAGWHDRTAEAFRRSTDAAGLRCDSAHVAMAELRQDAAGKIAMVRDTGCDWLVCSSPEPSRPLDPGIAWIPAMVRAMTLDAWRRNAATLNAVAAQAQAAGLKLAYHNHPAEFALCDGRRGWDVLLQETDPALVSFELDVAWAAAGGTDPAKTIRRHAGRIALLHLKDLTVRPPHGRLAADFTTCEVGLGVIDWPAVLAAARRARIAHAYVEQEPPFTRPILESLAVSARYLQRR